MTNPFDDPRTQHRVVVNDEGQHALWPSFAAIPQGWTEVFGPQDRTVCLDWVDRNWTDLTPRSAVAAR
ncbi:MbtH family protein [Streptomyces sp. XM4193]|uniref:MbtH family protein n=1 Tax=Streptomyces sp. XM4193 TaxID=2929782 RepID=UPI001FFB5D19|nr:MbtH family protein [Streptomyces sp. XM4193]MCK1797777.1 MbtH family protein [Streptomyces sp. XM4193]